MLEKKHTNLPLPVQNSYFYLIEEELKQLKEELETFLENMTYMNSLDFAKKVLLSQEIKSNNTIEGYLDDILLVQDIIRHPSNVLNEKQKRRILNLYQGYQFILHEKEINKSSLKELYDILSHHLLKEEESSL